MNFIKTPHEKLLEEAGAAPATPGMIKTPQQALMEHSGLFPEFASGGSVNDMLAELFNADQVPEHFRKGGQSLSNTIRSAKAGFTRFSPGRNNPPTFRQASN
jgi:hypothetical protein